MKGCILNQAAIRHPGLAATSPPAKRPDCGKLITSLRRRVGVGFSALSFFCPLTSSGGSDAGSSEADGAGDALAWHPPHVLRITVSSAVELEERQMELIGRKMRRLTGFSDVVLDNVIDPSLIAGFVISYGTDESMAIDLSVKGQLASLKNRADSFDMASAYR